MQSASLKTVLPLTLAFALGTLLAPLRAEAFFGFGKKDAEGATSPPSGLQSPRLDDGRDASAEDPKLEARKTYNHGVELFRAAQMEANRNQPSLQKRLLKESLAEFKKAQRLDPAFVEPISNEGYAYLSMERYDQAIGAFQRALAIDDKHLNTLNGLATAYGLGGQAERAVATFDRLTTLSPGEPQYHFNKGSLLQKFGKADEAEAAYRQALRLDGKHQASLFNLASLYENRGENQKAVDFYQQAKAADIGSPVGLEALRRLERLRQATQTTTGGTR